MLIDILSKELTIEAIINNINELGFNNDRIEMQLNAFFKKAKRDDIIQFAIKLYEKVTEINLYILSIIIKNMRYYKEIEVNNLFAEIYMNTSCSKDEINIINDYFASY